MRSEQKNRFYAKKFNSFRAIIEHLINRRSTNIHLFRDGVPEVGKEYAIKEESKGICKFKEIDKDRELKRDQDRGMDR
ncbi:MAG: hypothetical protein HRT90_07315 [Candidatus Margulisbacteria bacterium]|nr:hypothetical protein [Candidatus Margulisiibacteriota bacterium]